MLFEKKVLFEDECGCQLVKFAEFVVFEEVYGCLD